MKLALSVELEGKARLAAELMHQLNTGIGSPIEEFEDEEIDGLIRKLAGVDRLDDHGINQFLVSASKRRPLSVLRMLMDRIDTFEWGFWRDANALPIAGFNLGLEGLPQSPDYLDMLREVRDRSLPIDGRNRYLIPELFREITIQFSTNYLPVLDEWLETKEKDKVEAVAYLVKGASPAFVFSHSIFVAKVLDIANIIGEECVGRVTGSLRASAILAMRHGIAGEPFPEGSRSRPVETCAPGLGRLDRME